MDIRFRPLRALIFVVFCLGILAFTYLLVFRVDFGGSTSVTVRFPSVGTIQAGSPVRQSGVKVGSVARVSLAADARGQVDVELSLYRGLTVRTSDRIAIVTGGLLGDQYIDIQAGSAEAPLVGPGDTIEGDGGLDLKLLVDGGGMVIEDLGRTTKAIARFLEAHEDDLDRILERADLALAGAASAAQRADRLLERAEASFGPAMGDFQATLRSLRDTATGLEALVDNLARPGAVADLLASPTTAQKTAETLANLQAATKSLKTVAEALEDALR